MSSLQSLKNASNLSDVAKILGYKPAALSYLLYVLPSSQKYTTFEIPKKAGGVRKIHAPELRLKSLQKQLADLLYTCRDEIDQAKSLLAVKGRKPKSFSHGFRKRHSIVTNAREHRSQRYVLNLDIEAYFPSFNFGRVRGFFIKNADFKLNPTVATIIAQIACHQNFLPQGSPCSPVISDFVAHILDIRLVELAKRNFCTYSRYADDITISTNVAAFPGAIAYQLDIDEAVWVLSDQLLQIVCNAGFSVNHLKTRMQLRTGRQIVTGLVVNRKVNIRADYYRITRAMCHSLFSSGSFYRPKSAEVEGSNPDSGSAVVEPPTTIAQLEGILSHIFYVKEQEKNRTLPTLPTLREKKQKLTGIERLYDRMLFFKHFVNLEKPLVLCEGKTDSIYLKAAIRKLPAYHGSLITKEGKSIHSAISFFKYTNLSHKILRLDGGIDPLKNFILRYRDMLGYFKYAPLKHPVIILIDNDGGSKDIFSVMSKSYFNISLKTDAPFYHVGDNLYLIKTPELGESGISCIEDLFDKSVLQKELEGKTFNRKKDHGSANEFGKVIFAEKIVLPNADQIDFSKFSLLLDRILAVLAHYRAPVLA